jgi:NADH-quinone oxidoreductase subunit J
MWSPLHLIFYVFASIAVGSAVMVITAPHPVKSVLSLVVTFFAMSGIWMILHAEFLSLILLLVYVGAVMTLFLFIVMMLNVDKEPSRTGFVQYYPVGVLLSILMTGLIMVAVGPHYFGLEKMPVPLPLTPNVNNIEQLGRVLYTDYAYPFEIAGILLLVAIIAAITLNHRGPVRRLVQPANEQITADPKDRVRLIKMSPETNYPGAETRET